MQSYRVLLKERLSVIQALGKDSEKARVVIREKAFPGVFVQVGNLQQEISSEMAAGSFRVQDDQMVSE